MSGEPIKPTTGPIVACDNAIEHYDKALEELAADERKILDQLMRNRQDQETLRNSRSQWRHARDTLKRQELTASTSHCPDCGLSRIVGVPHYCANPKE